MLLRLRQAISSACAVIFRKGLTKVNDPETCISCQSSAIVRREYQGSYQGRTQHLGLYLTVVVERMINSHQKSKDRVDIEILSLKSASPVGAPCNAKHSGTNLVFEALATRSRVRLDCVRLLGADLVWAGLPRR